MSSTYNGAGVLVQRGATPYTQDLAAPLSQILNDGSANAVYGMDRLLSDGVATATDDALSRPVTITAGSQQRDATYKGDGVLVAYTENGVASQLTQDLAAPLAQILNDGSANAVYGHERLVTQQGATRTWYLGDALGSVRMTLDDAGTALGAVGYDPWGALQSPLRPPHAGEMTCLAPSASPANCKMMVTAGWCIYGRAGMIREVGR
ncbi:MAG: hypothetical protein MI924_16780 [Chloroflexales bacterium]|nr:hypothetical protein [Chloroflexales bacterium]